MYVWAAFEGKSPPTCQDLVTLIPNSSLESRPLRETKTLAVYTSIQHGHFTPLAKIRSGVPVLNILT
jgi:hypothetical protein